MGFSLVTFFYSNKHYITAHYWDFEEPSLLVSETKTLDQEENMLEKKLLDPATSVDRTTKNSSVRLISEKLLQFFSYLFNYWL